MDNLTQLKLLVRMNERLGIETDQQTFDKIAAEEARIAAEQQKQQTIQEERKSAFKSIFADLSTQLGQLMVEEKKKTEEEQALLDRFANVLSRVDDIKTQVAAAQQQTIEQFVEDIIDTMPEEVIVEAKEVPEETIKEEVVELKKPKTFVEAAVEHVSETTQPPSMFVQPNPPTIGRDIQDIQRKLKLIEGWVSKISMTGPGGGAVWLRDLEDVAHYPVKNAIHGQALVYNAITKKWEPHYIITTGDSPPAYPNDGDVWYNTTDAHTYIWLVENDVGQWVDIIGGSTNIVTSTVTTSTYTVGPVDNYIGVNYAGPVTITLPAVAALGRVIIIKDESGHCSFNHITLAGNIDNDAGGAILRVDNGAIQMVYRAGWRIV